MTELSPLACRVIGVLLEKERTVPATYPLTPKAVVSGCNQTTGRDPIMTITAAQVDIAIRELRDAKFARTVHASHGARTEKYRQVLDDALGLDSAERAVITLLLLRGAQTPGELRSRSDRLHAFGSVDEVDAALAALAAREEPLVEQLERRPGQKEQRWIHLLGTEAERTSQTGASGPTSASSTTLTPSAQPARAAREPLPPELAPLVAFIGTWIGTGESRQADTEPVAFYEVLSLRPHAGPGRLGYSATTTTAEGGHLIHEEIGYLRSLGDGAVELVVAQGSGVAEISEGLVDDRELILSSRTVATTSSVPPAGSVDRRYHVADDVLRYEVSISAGDGGPTRLRLTGALRRRDDPI